MAPMRLVRQANTHRVNVLAYLLVVFALVLGAHEVDQKVDYHDVLIRQCQTANYARSDNNQRFKSVVEFLRTQMTLSREAQKLSPPIPKVLRPFYKREHAAELELIREERPLPLTNCKTGFPVH